MKYRMPQIKPGDFGRMREVVENTSSVLSARPELLQALASLSGIFRGMLGLLRHLVQEHESPDELVGMEAILFQAATGFSNSTRVIASELKIPIKDLVKILQAVDRDLEDITGRESPKSN